MIWTLEIPGFVPAPLNRLTGHWAERHRLKKRDAQMIGFASQAYRVPAASGKRKVSMTIVFPPKQRMFDKDALWKSTLDALVQCGALKDDNPKWVEFGPPSYARGEELKTYITIEDIP